MNLHMLKERDLLSCSVWAFLTSVRFFSCMNIIMQLNTIVMSRSVGTEFTLVRFFSSVLTHVDFERLLRRRPVLAHSTRKRLYSTVLASNVGFHVSFIFAFIRTERALRWHSFSHLIWRKFFPHGRRWF